MKILAIRDRLLDYFVRPVIVEREKDYMAAVATAINDPETKDAIAQAPHHFEIWQIGEISEEGDLVAKKEILIGCSSLVRVGVRTAADRRGGPPSGQPGSGPGSPLRAPGEGRANGRAVPGQAPGTDLQTQGLDQTLGGGHSER